MNLSKNDLHALIKKLTLADELKVTDIPNIDLYMDQLTQLIDSKLGRFKRDETDKILTKTMINNYTKAGLLMPPKNKKYSRDHIILLILVYFLKNILSIADIKSLFTTILNNIATRDDDVICLEDMYSTFLELNNIELDNFYNSFIEKFDLIKTRTQQIDKENKDTAEMFLVVIMLVAQANAQKILAEKIIDKYFK